MNSRLKKIRGVIGSTLLLTGAVWLGLRWQDGEGPVPEVASALPTPTQQAPLTYLPASQAPKPRTYPSSQLIGSGFSSEQEAVFSKFKQWAESYALANPSEKQGLEQQGIQLASQRRAVLKQWIMEQPARALAAAVPYKLRKQLPASTLPLLEQRVSGRATVERLAAVPEPGSKQKFASYRAAVLNGQEYKVYTYGRRDQLGTLQDASVIGISLDGQLALADSPVRVVEQGESLEGLEISGSCPVSSIPLSIPEPEAINANEDAPTVIEVAGKIELLCDTSHLAITEEKIIAAEHQAYHHVAADSGAGSSGVAGRPGQAWTHGDKSVLVIRVDFSDLPGTPLDYSNSNAQITESYVVDRFNGTNGVNSFYEQSSYNKTSLVMAPAVAGDSPDVTGVLRLPQTASHYATGDLSGQIHSDARAAAQAAGFNVDGYDRIGVVFSRLSALVGSQITYGGLGSIVGENWWINGSFSFSIITHEIGHNYGLPHSSLWSVTDGNPISATGTSALYGDIFDIMGDGTAFENDFSHWNKSLLQWLPDSSVTNINAGGTFRVYRFDHPAANLNNARALKIVRNRNEDYWIGLRRGTSNASMDNGAYVLWGYNENNDGNLIDLTSPVNTPTSAALATGGAAFSDATAGITLQAVAQGGTGAEEWLDLQVTLNSRIAWEVANTVADEQGGTATVKVARSYNSTGAVSVNYATSNGTATAGSDFTSTSGTLNWASGDLTPKTVTVPITSDATVEGSETFTITLSSVTGAVLVDDAATTVTIADAGARDPTYAPEFTNSTVFKVLPMPDGTAVLGGVFDTIQDVGFNVFTRGGITKVTTTGAHDTTFGNGAGAAGAVGGNSTVWNLARQQDGKIIVVGDFTSFHGVTAGSVARLVPDGTLDSSFSAGTGSPSIVYAVALQPDGKIILGGSFTTFNGISREYLVRLNVNGSVDTGWSGPDFGGAGGWRVESLALQPDGKLLVGGSFYFSGASFKGSICRLLPTGALDPSFSGISQGAHVEGNTNTLRSVLSIAVEDDGRILIGGVFTAYNNTARGGLARLTSSGALDPSFATTSDGTVYDVLVQPDGRVLAAGAFTTMNSTTVNRLARLSAAGVLETNFSAGGGHGSTLRSLAMQQDGRFLIGGNYSSFQGSTSSGPYWRFFGGMTGTPGVIQIAGDSVSAAEGSSATVQVSRTGGSTGALTVGYATVIGTAGAADFTASSGFLRWADGDTANKSISVPLAADATSDAGETFYVNLGQPTINAAPLGALQQATVTITEEVVDAFTDWKIIHFTAGDLADANISGNTADPDKDGYNNLLEFAFGSLPKTADSANLLAASVQNVTGTNYLTISFPRRTPAGNLTYNVQTSGDLSGVWETNGVEVSATAEGAGFETAVFRDAVSQSSTSRRFMRVQVVLAP